jgi:hypothetical protein
MHLDVNDPEDGDSKAADARVGQHEVGEEAVADAEPPGIGFMNIHLGRKLFGHFKKIQEIKTKSHPKIVDKKLFDHFKLKSWGHKIQYLQTYK